MTRSAKTAPAPAPDGAPADSAPDTPPDARPGPSAAAPPAGPAAAIVAALTAAPGATTAQLAETAGIARQAAARELATLEKAGHATRDRDASPATWTALHAPDEAPGNDSPDSLTPSIAAGDTAAPDADTIGAEDPDPEKEDAGPAVASPAEIAPGAGEALGAAGAAAAQAQAALQAGDLDSALAAADHLTQAAARTRRLLRAVSRAARRGPTAGTPPGELRGLVAAHLAACPAQDFGPHAIGRVLGRSSGAVANALDRLTALGQAQLTSEAPRRYRYADPPAVAS
jgi:hypothetical protein